MDKMAGLGRKFRGTLERGLRDPIALKGFEEQDTVVQAAALVRNMRQASGLTQLALATELGTSQAHLSMLERGVGRNGPTFLMLQKIAQACRQELVISFKPVEESAAQIPTPFEPSSSADEIFDIARHTSGKSNVA